jgi:nitric oxide synthase oxygenase domain/subunit
MMDKNNRAVGALTLHSLNVRGLRDPNKRDKVFEYLAANFKGILFLQ